MKIAILLKCKHETIYQSNIISQITFSEKRGDKIQCDGIVG